MFLSLECLLIYFHLEASLDLLNQYTSVRNLRSKIAESAGVHMNPFVIWPYLNFV